MRYYVIAPDGQKFGPADVALLQQWADEGRMLPTSLVEEEFGGLRIAASAIPGVRFRMPGGPTSSPYGAAHAPPQASPSQGAQVGGNPYESNPYTHPSNYYRGVPQSYSNASDVNNAWICAVVGLMCCGPVSIAGIVLANKARQAGNPNAQAPYIVNIVVTCIWGLGIGLYMIAILFLGAFG